MRQRIDWREAEIILARVTTTEKNNAKSASPPISRQRDEQVTNALAIRAEKECAFKGYLGECALGGMRYMKLHIDLAIGTLWQFARRQITASFAKLHLFEPLINALGEFVASRQLEPGLFAVEIKFSITRVDREISKSLALCCSKVAVRNLLA